MPKSPKRNFVEVANIEPNKTIPTAEDKKRCKPTIEYCKANMPNVRKMTGVKFYMITCTYSPDYTFKHAWATVDGYREIITNYLLNGDNDVHFVMSTIEHHHNLSERVRKVDKVIPEEKVETEKSEGDQGEVEKGEGDDMIEVKDDVIARKAYQAKNLDDFAKSIERWTIKEDVRRDLDSHDMVVCYYNFFQMMKYLSSIYKRDDDLINFIDETLEVASDYLETDSEVNFDDTQLAILTTHKKIGFSLLGYPHIHITVGISSSLNPDDISSKILKYVRSMDIFPDPKVEHTKYASSGDDGKGIMYITKNHKNSFVKSMMKEIPIVKLFIPATNYTKYYLDFFVPMMSKEIIKAKYFKPECMALYVEKARYADEVLDILPFTWKEKLVISSKDSDKIVESSINVAPNDPESDNYHKLVGWIIDMMKSNDLKICDDKIYKKVTGTKMTYHPFMDIEEFYTNTTSSDPINKIAPRYKNDMIDRMRLSQKECDLNFGVYEQNYKIRFPSITIDYRMMEFKDFFYNTLTCEIYRSQDRYYCYYYAPVCFNNLYTNLSKFRDNSVWLNILRHNKLDYPYVYAIFFNLLRPHEFKMPVPFLYGESNSGKTTSVKPFINYYPTHKVGVFLNCLTEHHIASMVVGRELLVFDEYNQPLNNKSYRATNLKTFEGGPLVSNIKHGDISNTLQTAAMVVSINPDDSDNYYLDPAMKSRFLALGEFVKFPNTISTDDRLSKEAPYIYLHCGLVYSHLNMDNKLNIVDYNTLKFNVKESLTTDDIARIEGIKKHYQRDQYEVLTEDIYDNDTYDDLNDYTLSKSHIYKSEQNNNFKCLEECYDKICSNKSFDASTSLTQLLTK